MIKKETKTKTKMIFIAVLIFGAGYKYGCLKTTLEDIKIVTSMLPMAKKEAEVV